MFCACRGEFIIPFLSCKRCSYDSILQANHFLGVTTSCVFCLSKDIEKSSTRSICGLLSNLFCQSPFQPLSSASPSSLALFPASSYDTLFTFAVIISNLHILLHAIPIPFYSHLSEGINQNDTRKGKGFAACASFNKGRVKANNYMLSRSAVLGIGWLWLSWADSMSMSRKEKDLLELWLNLDSVKRTNEN